MARFINSQGFWVDTDEEEPTGSSWYASLVPTMHPSGNPGADPVPLGGVSAPKDSAAVIADRIQSQSRIDTYTAEMVANVDVKSAAGSDALRALLADPMQDNEVRAAASQALHPGIQASIGKNGELSFSAAPGSDLGFDYSGRAARSNPELAARTKPALDKLDNMFANIQNLSSPEEIIAAYSEIQLISNDFLASKKAQYEQQLGKPLGVEGFASALAQSRAMDKQAWNQYYGGVDMGDSDETMALIGSQTQIRNILDQQVGNKLKTDPDAVAIASRMRWLDGLVQARLGSLDNITEAGMVSPVDIDGVFIGRGVDPATATDQERLIVAQNLANGDAQTHAALQISQATIPDLVIIAADRSGRQSNAAIAALENKFDEPAIAKQLVEAVRNFDTLYAAHMTADERAEFEPPPRDAGATGKQLEALQQELQAKKVRHVLADINSNRANSFIQRLGEWDSPQAPEIAEEWIATVEAIKAAKIDGSPVMFQEVADAMVWPDDLSSATTKIRALSEYVASQAARASEISSLGPIPLYSDPMQVEGMLNSIVVGQRWRTLRRQIAVTNPVIAVPASAINSPAVRQAARSMYGSTIGAVVDPLKEFMLLGNSDPGSGN